MWVIYYQVLIFLGLIVIQIEQYKLSESRSMTDTLK